MKCPSDEQLLLCTLGELSVNESDRIEQHRTTCSRCRAALHERLELLACLRAPPRLASSEDAFAARVLAAREHQPRVERELPRPRLRAFAAALAAAVVLAVLAPHLFESAPELSHRELLVGGAGSRGAAFEAAGVKHMRARGTRSTEQAEPFAELLRVRDGVFEPLAGATLRQGDALAVRCSNPRAEPVWLTVFALDAAHSVHWLFPAYVDVHTNPESLAIGPHVRDRLLDEVVEPDAPAVGALRVFAVFSRVPLTVAQIEAQRRAFDSAAMPAFLGQARVQRWSTSWNER